MCADTYIMFLGLFRRRPPAVEGERLFQPPAEVAQRTDSIDEAIARDLENTPRAVRIGFGALSVFACSNGLNIGGGGQPHEITKVWGTHDTYQGPEKSKP